MIDAGNEARVEISALKFYAARMLHDVIDRAMQTHGALGLTDDSPLSSMYRNARAARIYDGPDEPHRMVVSRGIPSVARPLRLSLRQTATIVRSRGSRLSRAGTSVIGQWSAPGIRPCRHSDGSRTSRATASPASSRRAASWTSTSGL